ncbi:hypothetical protein P3T27_005055 [Kitasatospora sp. MAA19]|nr:hypothetical protein [Kitasatospora sp. MAA19]
MPPLPRPLRARPVDRSTTMAAASIPHKVSAPRPPGASGSEDVAWARRTDRASTRSPPTPRMRASNGSISSSRTTIPMGQPCAPTAANATVRPGAGLPAVNLTSRPAGGPAREPGPEEVGPGLRGQAGPGHAHGHSPASAYALVGLRAVMRRTVLGPPVRRFVQPLWALVHTGIATSLTVARTRISTYVTDRIEQWAIGRCVRPHPPNPSRPIHGALSTTPWRRSRPPHRSGSRRCAANYWSTTGSPTPYGSAVPETSVPMSSLKTAWGGG